MDIEAVTESIWQHTLRRSYFPEEWKGRLTIDQAYRVQLGLLDRWVARGERLAGWKVGLTAPVLSGSSVDAGFVLLMVELPTPPSGTSASVAPTLLGCDRRARRG